LGGYESLLFADRNPATVKGMVLVDPSFPDQFRTLRRNRPDAAALIDGFAKLQDQYVETCIRDLKARAGAPDWSDKDHCLDFPTDYPQELKAAFLPERSNPAKWETALSFFRNGETDALQTINPARRYGAMPIVVLTAAEVQALPPGLNVSKQEAQGYAQFTATDWREAHDQMAALSTRGQNRLVQGSSHYIHLIKPEVVIAAIEEVVNDARGGKAH
jgi:pimeloyl-ACP methyl ester carboxylesterase